MVKSADPDQFTDLDLHCLQRRGLSGLSRFRVKACLSFVLDADMTLLRCEMVAPSILCCCHDSVGTLFPAPHLALVMLCM